MQLVFLLLTACFPAAASPSRDVREPAIPVDRIEIVAGIDRIIGRGEGVQLLVRGFDSSGNPVDVTDEATIELVAAGRGSIDSERRLTAEQPGSILVRARYAEHSVVRSFQAEPTERPRPVGFRHELLNVLTREGCNAGACHGTPTGKNGFRLSLRGYLPDQDHASLTREFEARRIDRVSPEDSLLLRKGTATVPHEGGRRLIVGDPSWSLIRRWIEEGARDDPADALRPIALEIVSAATRIDAPRDRVRLAAVADYSDATRRDVTRLVRFSSSDETIARVDEAGLVTRVGFGEVLIQVALGSILRTIRLNFRDVPDGSPWVEPPSRNFIDRALARKWREMRLRPSSLAEDGVFLRRLCFDVIGRPPTVEELREFLADRDPGKRDRWIDRLIGSPEYVDHWAAKWADRLGCNQRFTGFKGAYSYHRWIRDQVAANVPFDRFVRTIVTARGANYSNPPASFYRRIRSPEDAAETVSQLFLGIRIQCARCHNHVSERWTRDDYYGFAAFFGRLRYKDGPQYFELYNKEETVYLDPERRLRRPGTREEVAPRMLGASQPIASNSLDPREELAEWLTSRDNPYFAKATVNRLWFHLFGKGIIDPVDDMRDSNLAASPELLDELAADFVAHDFDVEHTLRTILRSRAYQLSATPNPSNRNDARYFSRANVRLLSAERLLDAISAISEVPERLFHLPAGTTAAQIPDGEFVHPFLRSFGSPRRSEACECERESDSTLEQALQIVGGKTVHMKIQEPKNRIGRLLASGASDEAVVDDLFLACLSRQPDDAERAAALGVMGAAGPDARRKAIEDLFWSLLNHPEFLFQH